MRSPAPLGLALLCSVIASGVLPEPRPRRAPALGALAHAEDPPVVLSQCSLRGVLPVPKKTQVFDAAKDGRLIGEFTGTNAPLTLTIPTDPATTRGRVATSAGKPTLRIDGWASVASIPVHTSRDVPVLPEHVWIASGHRVKVTKGAGTTLTAELVIAGSQDQTLRGSAPCDSFTLDRKAPTAQDIPGNARGYQTRSHVVNLFDGASGTEILTMNMVEGTSQLFWSTETRGGFVHVKGRGDVVIDAWMRLRDLNPLKAGEMMDQQINPSSQVAGAQLMLDKPPRLVTVAKDVPVRSRPDDKEKPIGVVESGAEVYEVGTMAKWANVMPKDLYLSPASDGGFWVPAADLPK